VSARGLAQETLEIPGIKMLIAERPFQSIAHLILPAAKELPVLLVSIAPATTAFTQNVELGSGRYELQSWPLWRQMLSLAKKSH
jgi:hypothetical protein